MTLRSLFLRAYNVLLQFYPPAFRRRFAPEMLEIAVAAAPEERVLILVDTSIAIARCWFQGKQSVSRPEPDAYVAIGESRISAARFIPGIALSVILALGLCYINDDWPPPCGDKLTVFTYVVPAPQHGSAAIPAAQR